jgi:2-alkyl-3-oxoalkanoate reductase
MNVFIAGATGAVGRALIPKLIEHGHAVTGTTRSPAKADSIRALGATPAVADGLGREAVAAAVRAAQPDVIVHQMTALAGLGDPRKFQRSFAATDRLRTEGTDNLLAAAAEVGATVVAQSYAGWPYEPAGGAVKDEDAPLMADPPKQMRGTVAALRHVEGAVTAAGGIALRYGGFYGPGTGLVRGGEQWKLVQARKFPIVGDGGGIWSWIHLADAAEATRLAVEHKGPAIYNVVDDDPAAVREWLPVLAQTLGAKPPRRFPVWLARLVAGEFVVTLSTEARGASNAKAKRELGWAPQFSSWRDGFPATYSAISVADQPTSRPATRTGQSLGEL